MTGDANLGSLVAKLGIDTATLRNTIGEAKQHFTKLKLDTDQAASGIGGAFTKAGAIAAGSILAIGVAAAAFSIKASGAFEDVGKEVIKLQRFTGGTAEEMSKLRFAAQQSGVGADQLANSFKFLSRNLAANKGDFDHYGVATVDAAGKSLSLAQVFSNVAQRSKEMGSVQDRTAMQLKLLGKAGTEMGPLLNKGADGIKELGAQAAKYGLVLDTKMIESVKRSVAAHREQAAAWQGLQVQIGSQVLPALTSLSKSFTEGLLVVVPAVSRIIGDTIVPTFGYLADVVGTLTHLLAAHTDAAKALGVVIGGPVVLALTAWAAAQAKVLATSIGTFLTEGAAGAAAMAVNLNLLTANAETGALSLKAVNVATGAAFAGIGLVIAKIIGDYGKMKSAAEGAAAGVTRSAGSPQAALEAQKQKLAEYHKEMAGGVNVLGLHVRATDRDAKAAAEASNGYKATKAEIERLNTELGNADDVSGAVEDAFTKQGLALESLGGATKLTTAQVEQLAASMNIDLSKASKEQKEAMVEQAGRLAQTSVAALKLADDNKVLGNWTKTAAERASALADALQQVIGVQVGVEAASRNSQAALDAIGKQGIDDAKAEADANRQVKATIDGMTSATNNRIDAEKTLQDILHPTARTKEEADLGLSDAQHSAARAAIAVRTAQESLDKLHASGKATPDQIATAELDLDTEAERGTAADALRSGVAWWPVFAASEAAGWAEAFDGFDATEAGPWRCVGRPRPVSLDYEEAVFADMGGKVGFVQPGTLAMMITVLLHVVDAGWLVAAVDGRRYRPGWPPTFIDGSPACGGP